MKMTAAAHILLVTTVLLLTSQNVRGHGRLVEPPSRSSMWRYGFNTPHNYDDNGLNCGGMSVLWYTNHGKCGVCGDAWNEPEPRANEAGGHYGTGTIAKTYTPGQTIDIGIEVTANHLGWFEFRLCVHNSPTTPITQQCLDQHLLQLADGSGTRYTLAPMAGTVNTKVILPSGVTCTNCVLQWKWHSGNNHGGNDDIQEEFYGCSDVAIIGGSSNVTPVVTAQPPVTQPTTAPPTTVGSVGQGWSPGSVCHAINAFHGMPDMDRYCTEHCTVGNCPLAYCSCSPPAVTSGPQTTPNVPSSGTCHGIGPWQGVPILDSWCVDNCARGLCPMQNCRCDVNIAATATPTTTITTTAAAPTATPSPITCQAIGQWRGTALLDTWCTENCARGLCPMQSCRCDAAHTSTPPPQAVTSQAWSGACYGINSWQGVPELDLYCREQCPLGNCLAMYCACPVHVTASTGSPTTPFVQQPTHLCHAIGSWQGDPAFDQWCNDQCPLGTCPSQYCQCGTLLSTPAPVVATAVHGQCYAAGQWAGQAHLDQWCSETCSKFACDPQYCSCGQTIPSSTTTAPSAGSTLQCYAINALAGMALMDTYCQGQCRGGLSCPAQYCTCGPRGTQPPSPTTTTTTLACRAINTWAGLPELDLWCVTHCAVGNCPPAYCHCGP